MALCPFAEHKLLPENSTQARITPRVIVDHAAAGTGSLYSFFRWSSTLEATFWVRYADGGIEQYMDTEVRADANLHANGFASAIETENSHRAVVEQDWDRDPFSGPQISSLIRLHNWLATVHPTIARRQVDRWDGTGLGWHIMFGTPGPWTPVAKACPGKARIAQIRDILIPAFAAGVNHPAVKAAPAPLLPQLTATLNVGSTGPIVGRVQGLLKWCAARHHWNDVDPGAIDDHFGPGTAAAAVAFKQHVTAIETAFYVPRTFNRIDPAVGPVTLHALIYWAEKG